MHIRNFDIPPTSGIVNKPLKVYLLIRCGVVGLQNHTAKPLCNIKTIAQQCVKTKIIQLSALPLLLVLQFQQLYV